ncbi:MAG: hypothetical protein LBS62_08770 [Clostridiales bacterium]|jgi:hypothetical protein|nr:hypothetical protein [Clostridiales bacterium]
MDSRYILRRADGELRCFYRSGGCIIQRTFSRNKWTKPTVAAGSARENFTLTMDGKGRVYLFAQETNGDIILCTDADGEWTSKVILENRSPRIYDLRLYPIMTGTSGTAGKGMWIIYNVPAPEERANYLVIQQAEAAGRWSPASRVDKFVPAGDFLFELQEVAKGHALMFYQTRTQEINIGYREITFGSGTSGYQQSGYNIFHSTNYFCTDHSFLTVPNAIHLLYIIKSMFSYQLIYRKKTSAYFDNPVVLWESQHIESCLLFYAKDNLHAVFCSNGAVYECVSENKGETFYRAARYKNKCCLSPVKARYVSAQEQSENNFYCRQLYVNAESPWDIQLLPELCEDFYPETGGVTASGECQPDSDALKRMRDEISYMQAQMDEKDNQILRMSATLKKYGAE